MNGKSLMKYHCQKKMIFFSNLDMKYITDVNNIHAKRVCNDFDINNLGDYDFLVFQKLFV